MSDGADPKHVQSFFHQDANPAFLLSDEDVEKILSTIPDHILRGFLARHMMAAEKIAFERGLAEGAKK